MDSAAGLRILAAMKSPFPGMDPFLEPHWRDVHQAMIIYSRDNIQRQLPAGLKARVEERLVLEEPFDYVRKSYYPDVSVAEHRQGGWTSIGTTLQQPEAESACWVEVNEGPVSEPYLEIRESRDGGRVITVLEFLSPANKLPGRDRDIYLQKMDDLRAAGVSTVEIDLLRRGGQGLAELQARRMPQVHSPYAACVRRPWIPYKAQLWHLHMHRPMPAIQVPLRESEPEATVNLQQILDQCYENGAYGDTDYTRELDPPLTAEEKQWVAGLVARRAG
jgi:Protein of unknown function (DUF4058)